MYEGAYASHDVEQASSASLKCIFSKIRIIMCVHRKEICSICRCPIEDMVVVCDVVKNKMMITNPFSSVTTKTLPYSYDTINMIMSMHRHEIPTVDRSSSLCRSHYEITPGLPVKVPYDVYREKMDIWKRT